MKKTLLTYLGLAVVLQLAGGGLARGDDASAVSGDTSTAQKLKTCTGIVTAVDPQQRTVSVKSWWWKRTFNAADPCKVTLEDKPEAALAGLHAGQKVTVRYENADGVLVAERISQHNRVYTGSISALDPEAGTLKLSHGWGERKFALGENCEVRLVKEKSGSLNDLKLGQTVSVVYESGKGALTAQRIEQRYPTFEGTVRAIDADARTVKAKHLFSEKTFHLADGCRIVVNGKLNGSLEELRIGDTASFTYQDTHGVLVASRIGQETEAAADSGAQASNTKGAYPAN